MNVNTNYSKALLTQGFAVINDVYSAEELGQIISMIDAADQSGDTFRKTDDLFAVRQFLKEMPGVLPIILNKGLKDLLGFIFGESYFVSKSIYFDKPEKSNWFVAWHRDLTISVNTKVLLPGFTNWTRKHNQFAVQPPFFILKENFTIRIHLDDTDKGNGALRVVAGSHVANDLTVGNFSGKTEVICNVKAGGVMIMRPLLMHASNRTVNNKRRRVIHIEFSNAILPSEIEWSEKITIALNI
jgi:hypothetical protein